MKLAEIELIYSVLNEYPILLLDDVLSELDDARKMLAKHSPGSSLEVLLYAIARHMVIGHESSFENLLSVAAIALIFVVRKFFFVPAFGAHLPDGNPAPDLSPNQSGIPASEFKERLRKRLHAEDVVPETEEDDFVDAAEADEFLPEST